MEFVYLLIFFSAGIVSQLVADYFSSIYFIQQNKKEEKDDV